MPSLFSVPVPAVLADVALIDGPAIAAAGSMSLSKFYALVAAGKAPKPVVRQSRFARWSVPEVRQWLSAIAAGGAAPDSDCPVIARAKRGAAKSAALRAESVLGPLAEIGTGTPA